MSYAELETYSEFFEWCRGHSLVSDRQIASAFGRTPQTIRNWKRSQADLESRPPRHLGLACAGYVHRQGSQQAGQPLPEVDTQWFKDWRHQHDLGTLEATGMAFGLTRQAIHNWHKRHRLPRWLGLACTGYEIAKSGVKAD